MRTHIFHTPNFSQINTLRINIFFLLRAEREARIAKEKERLARQREQREREREVRVIIVR